MNGRRWCLLLIMTCVAPWSTAGEVQAASADVEIAYLIGVVEASPCEFERNGAWYDGRQAATHLRDKYHWLAHVYAIASAEQFIEQVASSSSFSGHPYALRCAGSAEMNTAPWLSEALGRYRALMPSKEVAHPPQHGAPTS